MKSFLLMDRLKHFSDGSEDEDDKVSFLFDLKECNLRALHGLRLITDLDNVFSVTEQP